MSVSYIPENVKFRLWGKSAGRCQYEGCNDPLWLDTLTQAEFNAAYIAHIIADRPDGPRGDPILSEKLKSCITNLMVLCDGHHRFIDKHDVEGHPPDRLRAMKAEHEKRIDLAVAIGPERQSSILLYGTNIGDHSSPLRYELAAQALCGQRRYPASKDPIRLDAIDSAGKDDDPAFWPRESADLGTKFGERVKPQLASGSIKHISVFARAPQPLLMLLGTMLTEIGQADVYQLHREPTQGWAWPRVGKEYAFEVTPPKDFKASPALILSLSATIELSRVSAVMPEGFAPWVVSVVPGPRHDCICSPEQLSEFRILARTLLNDIKAAHGQDTRLHIFPAAPVSACVELGRVRQPKADLKWRLYDQNTKRSGFVHCFDIE